MGCCEPEFWWGHKVRSFHACLDVVEFGCVLALIVLNAFYLLDYQQNHCYLDGYNGLTDLTVCYSVFWATVVAAAFGFAIAIGQCCTCCFTSVGAFLELVGSLGLSAWWFAMAVYWNYSGREANALNYPNQEARLAVMYLAWIVSASYIISAFMSFGRFISYCYCSPSQPSAKNVA